MSGRLLIVDTIASNRIVLKVKMQSAQYDVQTCATLDQARIAIRQARPDMILLNMADPAEDQHAFCHDLKSDPETADLAIIGVGMVDTCRARFAALDAGADEVMPRPIEDALLLARIRSLLRMRNANAELWLRDGTSRALGFEEETANFVHAAKIAVLTFAENCASPFVDQVSELFQRGLKVMPAKTGLSAQALAPVPDLFVIDATDAQDENAIFRLVSDLRSRADTRLSSQLVVLRPDARAVAAMALDLGADDVAFGGIGTDEITHRAARLVRRKEQQDKLRATVRNGLQAAVTDPLTGLYNRRYAEPHLLRLAEQATKTSQDLTVMMLDIDHFKRVNDTHGHAAGDSILRQTAQRFRENLRAVDMIARVGGEEFLIAMPNTNFAQAEIAADRLCRVINGKPYILQDGALHVRVTLSIGVAVWHTQDGAMPSGDSMCRQADEALYAAKLGGRDQVSFAMNAA
ncbi:diguanylate cyclase [Yoonia sp. 208BN28-4]|uniref:diguanylate cyclase n=1 Tax=Yoonia sp. 208BN28-4 TaxID=3126505 RepID=UPI0030ADA64A